MAWTWRYVTESGQDVSPVPSIAVTDPFPSQADAEAWVGEVWRDLLAAGVDAVILREGDRVVYGPMSLHPAS